MRRAYSLPHLKNLTQLGGQVRGSGANGNEARIPDQREGAAQLIQGFGLNDDVGLGGEVGQPKLGQDCSIRGPERSLSAQRRRGWRGRQRQK